MENVENIILEQLKLIRNELKDFRTETVEEFSDVRLRLGSLERGQSRSNAEYGDVYSDHARQQFSIDKIKDRLTRLERRLELSED